MDFPVDGQHPKFWANQTSRSCPLSLTNWAIPSWGKPLLKEPCSKIRNHEKRIQGDLGGFLVKNTEKGKMGPYWEASVDFPVEVNFFLSDRTSSCAFLESVRVIRWAMFFLLLAPVCVCTGMRV